MGWVICAKIPTVERKTNGEVARGEVASWTNIQETGFEVITTVGSPRSYIVGRSEEHVSAYVALVQSFKGSGDIPWRVPWAG